MRPPSLHDPPYAEVVAIARRFGHHVVCPDTGTFARACAALPGPVHDDFFTAPAPAFGVNEVVRSRASVLAVRVEPDVLLASALFGAATLGRYEDVRGCRSVCDVLGALVARRIPLLVATGCRQQQLVNSRFKSVAAKFEAGSPMLLVDKAGSLLCVAQPMGDMLLAPDALSGVLPAGLRTGVTPATGLQMFARVVCVAPRPKYSVQGWFRNRDTAFRWDMMQKGVNSNCVIPTNFPVVDLFSRYGSLDGLDACLGDYESKLAAMSSVSQPSEIHPVPRGTPAKYGKKKEEYDRKMQQRRHDLTNSPAMATEWRRALLIQRLLEEDSHGVARAALAGVLPERMLGPARACTAPPVGGFGREDLRAVDAGTLDEILAAVRGVRMA